MTQSQESQSSSSSDMLEIDDVKLIASDGTEFRVDRNVLLTQSEFFYNLHSEHLEHQNMDTTIVLSEIKPNILQIVLKYLQTKQLDINTENMLPLLVASNFLVINALLQECKRFLLQNITIDNCVEIFSTAVHLHGLSDIADRCHRFLLLCFERAMEKSMEEAANMPYEALKDFLRSKSLNVTGEHILWLLIEQWVNIEPTERMPLVPELLSFLCINEIDEELSSKILASPIISENNLCKDLNDTLSNKDKLLSILSKCNEFQLNNQVRQPTKVHFVTKSICNQTDLFISYDDNFDIWRKVGENNMIKKLDSPLFRIDECVYLHCTDIRDPHSNKECLLVYNLLTNGLSRTSPLPFALPQTWTIILETSGHIYALGRFRYGNGEVYMYISEKDEWLLRSAFQPMDVEAAVGMNGLLYAIGTRDGAMVMQVYSPSENEWTNASPPNIYRVLTTTIVYRDKIFLIGGSLKDEGNSKDVEVYDPDEKTWTIYPELPYEVDVKSTVLVQNALVLDEKLHVYRRFNPSMGGVYWDGSGEWKKVQNQQRSPLIHKSVYRFCSIEDQDIVRQVMEKNKAVDISDWIESGI